MTGRHGRIASVVLAHATILLAGCAATQEPLAVPIPAEAQQVWTAYWTAVERGDVAAWNRVVHSSLRAPDGQRFDPLVQADARSFLALCAVRPDSMAMGGDRASYRTRCAAGPSQSGLYPYFGAEMVLRRDEDGAWRFFCFGCGLPYHPHTEEDPPSPYDAQRLWVAFWSAVERGDLGAATQLMHAGGARATVQDFGRPEMRGEARTFLYLCSIQQDQPTASGDRALYRTRCLPRGGGGDMLLERDRDRAWKVMCFGNCPL